VSIVIDASVVVAALVDTGPDGTWAETRLASDHLLAPHLMLVEAASILRRAALAGDISSDVATMAHGDLLDLPVALFGYEPLAQRIWELRDSLTAYDAWYCALAEALDVPLATLDRRLSRASGPRCAFATPPA
jgi:predicted nucleic acid-binding protein